MKQLEISFLPGTDKNTPLTEISQLLDRSDRHCIDFVPWLQAGYKPEAQFSMAYSGHCLFLKYYIKENDIKSTYLQPNDPVYRDSCVEFFIAFDREDKYYNLEFNCRGTCAMGFGPERTGRTLLPDSVISKIQSYTVISAEKERKHTISWELTLMIPIEVFQFHKLNSFKGLNCSVNFYKCGDDLPDPHYLVWNNIQSEEPNFHLPEFFGKMEFV